MATKTTTIKVPKKVLTDAKTPRLRRQFRDDTWTEEQVAARKLQLTVEEVPEGWVKLADVSKKYQALGIPISRLVRAVGGDRGMKDPVHPTFRFVYWHGARWLSPAVLSEGLKLMDDVKFASTPRKPRVKKAASEKPAAKKVPQKAAQPQPVKAH